MGFIELILISAGLAMDAFSVSVAAGMSGKLTGWRATFRLAFHFGLFQFLMPVAGWLLGITIEPLIAAFDHWIAFTLLCLVGIHMIRSYFQDEPEKKVKDPSRGFTLVLLAISTSVDALAVGLSFALLTIGIWYPAMMIGLITALLSWIGVEIGRQFGKLLGKKMELVGGFILIGIAIRILFTHLQ